jgi:hypothetical protein
MRARRTIPAALLVLAFGFGCTYMGVSPSSRFQIQERFTPRLGSVEVMGVEVRSALPDRVLPDDHLEKLAGFLAHDLRQTTIGVVTNLNGGADVSDASIVLTVDVHRLDASTRAQQREGVPSRLYGTISLRRVATGRSLGTARIWVIGGGLDLGPTYTSTPDTVREFASVIRRVVL